MKFDFLHMKSDDVGTTLKHPETINDNIKNLSKSQFYFKNLILPLIARLTNSPNLNPLSISLNTLLDLLNMCGMRKNYVYTHF